MKKILSFSLALIMAMALAGCSDMPAKDGGFSGTPEAKGNDMPVLTTSRVTETSFADMGLPIQVPADGTNPVYAILEGEIAELKFTVEDCSYILRASKTLEGDELHGVDEQLKDDVTGVSADGENFCYSMSIFTMEQGGQIGTNTIGFLENDTIYLTLVSMEKSSDVESLLSAISNQVIETISSM